MKINKIPDKNQQTDIPSRRRLSFSFLNRGRSTDPRQKVKQNQKINNDPTCDVGIKKFNETFERYIMQVSNQSDVSTNPIDDRRSHSISRTVNVQKTLNAALNKSRWSCFIEDFRDLIGSSEDVKTDNGQVVNTQNNSRLIRPTNLGNSKKKSDQLFPRDSSITPTAHHKSDFSDKTHHQSSDATTPTQNSMISSFISMKSSNFSHELDSNHRLGNEIKIDRSQTNVPDEYAENNGPKEKEPIHSMGQNMHNCRRRNIRLDKSSYPEPMRRQRNLDVMNNRPVSENFSAINLHLNEDDNKTFSSHERINNYEINNNSVFNWPNHIQRKAHQAPTPVCYDQMMRDNHGSNRQFQRCFSEMPEVQSKYGECLKTDWYSNLLPYKLHPTSSTLTMHQIDSHPTRPPTRRMSRTNMAHRNIMTQSMIAYMPDDDSSNQSTPLDYTNVMDRSQNLSRISRTISTDRYSSDDVRPSLPSLTHLMSSMTSGESRQANHDNSQPNSSPDFLRDQKKFLNDVESRADSPRLDQYYRLFHVNSGRNQNANQKREYSSKKNSSNLLNEGSFNDCTLKRKDYSSVAPVTRRPSRPTFVGI